MWFHFSDALNRKDRCHWNNHEEEILFEWNVKRSINSQDLFAIKEPMSLRNRISIPSKEKRTDRKHADSNAFDATEHTGLEINLKPGGAAEGKYEHRHI